MKAESIEQIREHLAKGGRALAVLKDGRTDEVKRVDMGMLRVYAGIWSSSFACVDVDHWQLLPLEEKEPVPVAMEYDQVCDALKEKRRVQERGYCQTEQPVDHGTQKEIDASCGDPVPNQHLLSILRGTATLPESVSAQGHIYHKAQLEAADVIERQQKRIEELEGELAMSLHTIEGFEQSSNGTQKGQEERFRDSQKERMQRIRTRLLHGQWPEMQDLLSWWEATTGERIEWGRRCVICEGQGRLKSNSGDKRQGYEYTGCPGCTNGYSVRPTWMNQ